MKYKALRVINGKGTFTSHARRTLIHHYIVNKTKQFPSCIAVVTHVKCSRQYITQAAVMLPNNIIYLLFTRK